MLFTHSRGGLVLRQLVEANHGALSQRFQLGHAVLVAAPNEGTPLATPKRWEDTIGWLANLLELFPDNPWTTAASLVAESIVWLANRASGGIPGLGAMDAASDELARLQGPPGPPRGRYSALVANYRPDENLLAIALDVGVDAFFATANDLVVPTEGGWRTGSGCRRRRTGGADWQLRPGRQPAGRPAASGDALELFYAGRDCRVSGAGLAGQPQAWQRVRNREGRCPRGGRRWPLAASDAAQDVPAAAEAASAATATTASELAVCDGPRDTLHIMVLPEHNKQNDAQLLATFGTRSRAGAVSAPRSGEQRGEAIAQDHQAANPHPRTISTASPAAACHPTAS